MLEREVSEAMTTSVATVPADISIERFVGDYLLRYRHKSFPVVKDGLLFGMVAICDIKRAPEKDWPTVLIGEVAYRDVVIAHPHQSLSEISELMGELDLDRLPVVDSNDPKNIIGLIASTDIIRLQELSEFAER